MWHLTQQASGCRLLGSGLYADLLEAAARDCETGGPTWDVLAPHVTRDSGSALALRLMAGVHRLVLQGDAPQLTPHYPSVGGDAGSDGAWPAFREVLVAHGDVLRDLVAKPCQTNEVGRCAALLGGFLTVAAQTGLPLRIIEIGASAGLNLRWDRYRYVDDGGRATWGDPGSQVQLRGHWEAPAELLEVVPTVAERLACDPRPVAATSPEGRLALTASVWADQTDRFARLRGALDLAARMPVPVAPASAGDWLPEQLDEPRHGVATVVFHSVVLQYLPADERARVHKILAAAAERCDAAAPLAWLRMEPERPLQAMSVRLTVWPGGEERLLATAGAHGFPVRWH